MRIITIFSFVLISALLWFLLYDSALRNYSLIPALFAIQISLNDFLEIYIFSSVGRRLFLLLIFPGTVMHELSHYIAAKLLGCQVMDISLFRPDMKNGTLGEVRYRCKDDILIPIKTLFIGIAPFIGCGLLLVALFNFYNSYSGNDLITVKILDVESMDGILKSLIKIWSLFYLQFKINFDPILIIVLYMQICLGLGVAPSSADFKQFLRSFMEHKIGALILLLLLVSISLIPVIENSNGIEYGEFLTGYITLALNYVILISLISISLLLISIPLIFIGIKFLEIGFMFKFLSVLILILGYLVLRDIRIAILILISSILIFRYFGILTKIRK
ncbi:MAG: hypothetical protein DRO94_02115 [Candidatus Altiarchaeales archaeon]|nr:MAG: hypothetical protein DRO95_00015 [Candidatus Altiarchaeales archaeon]RLI94750.1 MAG: hypothetical protein DRO94_02115 [Candidatus Altiarchaeales archaeon]